MVVGFRPVTLRNSPTEASLRAGLAGRWSTMVDSAHESWPVRTSAVHLANVEYTSSSHEIFQPIDHALSNGLNCSRGSRTAAGSLASHAPRLSGHMRHIRELAERDR